MNDKYRHYREWLKKKYGCDPYECNVDELTRVLDSIIYNDLTATYDSSKYGYQPKKIIFNPPATIVIWEDGTKTVVKRQLDDIWDPEKAIALCFMKKFCGNSSKYNDIFKKYIKDTVYELQQ